MVTLKVKSRASIQQRILAAQKLISIIEMLVVKNIGNAKLPDIPIQGHNKSNHKCAIMVSRYASIQQRILAVQKLLSIIMDDIVRNSIEGIHEADINVPNFEEVMISENKTPVVVPRYSPKNIDEINIAHYLEFLRTKVLSLDDFGIYSYLTTIWHNIEERTLFLLLVTIFTKNTENYGQDLSERIRETSDTLKLISDKPDELLMPENSRGFNKVIEGIRNIVSVVENLLINNGFNISQAVHEINNKNDLIEQLRGERDELEIELRLTNNDILRINEELDAKKEEFYQIRNRITLIEDRITQADIQPVEPIDSIISEDFTDGLIVNPPRRPIIPPKPIRPLEDELSKRERIREIIRSMKNGDQFPINPETDDYNLNNFFDIIPHDQFIGDNETSNRTFINNDQEYYFSDNEDNTYEDPEI